MQLIAGLVLLMPFALAVLLGIGLPFLALAAYRRPGAGLLLVLVAWLLDALSLGAPLLRIGLTIYPPDLPMVLIGGVALARWLLRDDVPRRHPLWLLLVGAFLASLSWGLVRNGTTAGVEARPDYYAIAAASYAMSFPIDRTLLSRVMRWFSAAALVLMLLCAYRWIVYYMPIPELLPPSGVYNEDGAIRVIGSNFALGLAELLVLGLFFAAGGIGLAGARLMMPLLLGFSVVLQHRSVWLAGVAGLLLSLMFGRAQRTPLWQQVLLGLAVFTLTLAPLVLNQGLSTQLQTSTASALSGQGTVADRFQNWRATLNLWIADGPVAIAMGRARGSDATRVVYDESGRSRVIKYSAHNHYVNTLTGMGVLGLAAYLGLVLHLVKGLWRCLQQRNEDTPASAALLVLTGMQLVYFMAYGVDFVQYLVFGLALSWVATRVPQAKVQRRTPHPATLPASAR
jgi:hypothetical protein